MHRPLALCFLPLLGREVARAGAMHARVQCSERQPLVPPYAIRRTEDTATGSGDSRVRVEVRPGSRFQGSRLEFDVPFGPVGAVRKNRAAFGSRHDGNLYVESCACGRVGVEAGDLAVVLGQTQSDGVEIGSN